MENAEAQRRRERRGMGEKSVAPQAHPAGEHFQVRHGSVTLRPLRLCASALKILIPLRGLELQRGILPSHRRSRSRAGIRRHYVNYPDLAFPDGPTAYCGAENYRRLQTLKLRYAPQNRVRHAPSVRLPE